MTNAQTGSSAATGGSCGYVMIGVKSRAVAFVCLVDSKEAGLVESKEAGLATNGRNRMPITVLASIFINTGQSQHTLTAS
ncbi:hypothetical protein OPT61_g2591 [Boeremia exigua]|uniref:Uncharacterized protein n=1 Tax=Boeremia exigua TaxID=749465 RepID=A0ACC2IL23_9PLEO|nr:hypothetical protein OPT61_g2591 [Boeremia exigua]